eukprot:683042-Pyramimonas_sp.AAC.1
MRAAKRLQIIPDSRPRDHIPFVFQLELRPCDRAEPPRKRWDFVGLGLALRSEHHAQVFRKSVEHAVESLLEQRGVGSLEEL